jgi:hypothetical protein
MTGMEKKTVYLETSFISYLTSFPSTHIVTAGHQAITRWWWEKRRDAFKLYVSEPVRDEAAQGNPEIAAKRLAVIDEIQLIGVTDEAINFGKVLMQGNAIPVQAATDALHVAMSCVNGINYLLTWNCKHIANAERFADIERLCLAHGYIAPVICTPEELLGDSYDLE